MTDRISSATSMNIPLLPMAHLPEDTTSRETTDNTSNESYPLSSNVKHDSIPNVLEKECSDKKTDHLQKRLVSAQDSYSKEQQIPFELLMRYLYLQLVSDTTNFLQVQQNFLRRERQWQKVKESIKQQEITKNVQEVHTLHTLNKAEKALSTIGIVFSGIAALFGGMPILGSSACIGGALLALDSFLDDPVKKQLAHYISCGEKESENAWLKRMHIFSGLASFGLSVGLTGFTAFQIATKVADFAVTVAKMSSEQKNDSQRALLIELGRELTSAEINLHTITENMQQLIDDINQYYESIHQSNKREHSLIQHILRV